MAPEDCDRQSCRWDWVGTPSEPSRLCRLFSFVDTRSGIGATRFSPTSTRNFSGNLAPNLPSPFLSWWICTMICRRIWICRVTQKITTIPSPESPDGIFWKLDLWKGFFLTSVVLDHFASRLQCGGVPYRISTRSVPAHSELWVTLIGRTKLH